MELVRARQKIESATVEGGNGDVGGSPAGTLIRDPSAPLLSLAAGGQDSRIKKLERLVKKKL